MPLSAPNRVKNLHVSACCTCVHACVCAPGVCVSFVMLSACLLNVLRAYHEMLCVVRSRCVASTEWAVKGITSQMKWRPSCKGGGAKFAYEGPSSAESELTVLESIEANRGFSRLSTVALPLPGVLEVKNLVHLCGEEIDSRLIQALLLWYVHEACALEGPVVVAVSTTVIRCIRRLRGEYLETVWKQHTDHNDRNLKTVLRST